MKLFVRSNSLTCEASELNPRKLNESQPVPENHTFINIACVHAPIHDFDVHREIVLYYCCLATGEFYFGKVAGTVFFSCLETYSQPIDTLVTDLN